MSANVAMVETRPKPIPRISIGGLPIAVINREDSAQYFIDAALRTRSTREHPLVVTSANGQVLSLCAARDGGARQLFLSADMIHADGMPLVFASRLRGPIPLPERVATTDLFHDVARLAQKNGVSFYMLGASEENVSRAVAKAGKLYPDLHISGFRHGYMRSEDEASVVDEINESGADILWVAMGAPRELEFALRWRSRLKVGVVKTSGGLFDFLSGRNSRAPEWMQAAGLEWLYRLCLEPRRLFWRYATTNLRSAYILLTSPITTMTPLETG